MPTREEKEAMLSRTVEVFVEFFKTHTELIKENLDDLPQLFWMFFNTGIIEGVKQAKDIIKRKGR